MISKERRMLLTGCLFISMFVVWTRMIQTIDVQPAGVNGTDIGFATFNCRFHELTGVHMILYTVTDWLGLVPVFVCMMFGGSGLVQMMKRRSLLKVDRDIMILGIYYVIVIAGYLIFEMYPVNYRPVLIQGRMEASYPSSTTLLVLSVMLTLAEQTGRRIKRVAVKRVIDAFVLCFSAFMVVGRLISGVHWFTDIVGAFILSIGIFCVYKACVLWIYKEKS